MQDLTPQHPVLQAFDEKMEATRKWVGEKLDQLTEKGLKDLGDAMEEKFHAMVGKLGAMFGKASDTVKAPLRKPDGPSMVARSKQPVIEKAKTPSITPQVQKQMQTVDLSFASGAMEVPGCAAPTVPKVSMGMGQGGRGMGW